MEIYTRKYRNFQERSRRVKKNASEIYICCHKLSSPSNKRRGNKHITIIKAPPIFYRTYYVPQDILQNIFWQIPCSLYSNVKIWNNLFTVLHILSLHWWKLFWFCLLLLCNIAVSNAGNYTEPGFDWELMPKLKWLLVLISIPKWLSDCTCRWLNHLCSLQDPFPSK